MRPRGRTSRPSRRARATPRRAPSPRARRRRRTGRGTAAGSRARRGCRGRGSPRRARSSTRPRRAAAPRPSPRTGVRPASIEVASSSATTSVSVSEDAGQRARALGELGGVREVAVVREREAEVALGAVDGLGGVPRRLALGRVPRVPDDLVTVERGEAALVEDRGDEAHVLHDRHRLEVRARHPGGLLAAVLERVEARRRRGARPRGRARRRRRRRRPPSRRRAVRFQAVDAHDPPSLAQGVRGGRVAPARPMSTPVGTLRRTEVSMIDLHCHSQLLGRHRRARGSWPRLAAAVGLRAVALTDHDTVAGFARFDAACRTSGVRADPRLRRSPASTDDRSAARAVLLRLRRTPDSRAAPPPRARSRRTARRATTSWSTASPSSATAG